MDILFTHFDKQIPADILEKYQTKLPLEIQKKLDRYKRWQDRQASLIGKILLYQALKKYDYNDDCLKRITHNQHGRPFIDDEIDFNISHSGDCVACSITTAGRVGIDIEKINKINIEDFRGYFGPQEWNHICDSNNPCVVFYRYWTMYESVLKADGLGLSSEFSNITLHNNKAKLGGKCWFVKSLEINPEYICSIATDNENRHFNFIEIKYNDIIMFA
jgi:4'-phosphopantetheinyl transferase